jgi:8-oxo-dGTP diphosphatase
MMNVDQFLIDKGYDLESVGLSELKELFEAYASSRLAQHGSKPTLPVGVSVLLVDSENRILLGERINNTASGMFSTPGGRIELDEDMIACAIRETKEETGLIVDAEDVRIIGFKEHFRFGNHYVMFYAEVRRWSGELTNTEPHKCKEWQWFSVSEIPENCTEPKDILAKLTEPASRLAEVTAQYEDFEQAIADALGITGEYGFSELPERVATLRAELTAVTSRAESAEEDWRATEAALSQAQQALRDEIQKLPRYPVHLWCGGRNTEEFQQLIGLQDVLAVIAALPSDTPPQKIKAHSKSEYKRLVVQTEGKDVVVEAPSDTPGAQ